jgi:hypothetical protein
MGSSDGQSGHKKIIEFIPYKTMAMDLESILASLTRIYVSRKDVEMVELLSLCRPELFPVGSFDADAERYEYVLKLAVPVKFHHHLRDNIDKLRPRLLADITTVTAPYLHEVITEVFVTLMIEPDLGWRDAVMDWVLEQSARHAKPDTDLFILHAPEDEGAIVRELEGACAQQKVRVMRHALHSVKDKDVQHALAEFELHARFGVLVVSPALVKLAFAPEALEGLVSTLQNPAKRFWQIWDKIERPDVADFCPAFARSLALSTQRMPLDKLCELLLQSANLLPSHP